MEKVIEFIEKNKENYVDELKEYLRIPSISTLSSNKKDMTTCAKFVSKKLKDAGLSNIKIIQINYQSKGRVNNGSAFCLAISNKVQLSTG